MTRLRLSPLPFLALALLTGAPSYAQEVVQPLPGTTDADKLGDDIRRLGSNPRDVDALVDAARLSLKLDDISGAASLLQRAENVDPRNPRVKAGQGSVLVQSERPGQALRFFAQAEAAGLDAREFAADRGLAYDLTGEQARAQRDYARALRDDPDNAEIIRRYALSLGISGERERAVALLDPLVRRSDRAAWRTQAFVLAMTGDIGGASRIAATMIPGGAAGLSAFFERLPTLSPTDRAFAVHFGEVRPGPERLADARLAPPLGPLGREGGVALASARPLPAAPARSRERPLPATPVAPVVTAAVLPRTAPLQTPAPAPARAATVVAQAPVAAATLPPAAVRPTPVRVPMPAPAQTPPVVRTAAPVVSAPAQVAAAALPASAVPRPAPMLAEAREQAGTLVSAVGPTPAPSAVPAAGAPVQPAVPAPAPPASEAAAPVQPAVPAPAPPASEAAAQVQAVALPPSARVVAAPSARPRSLASARASEDTILAKIIANLSIPGSELGVGEPDRPAAPAAEAPRPEPAAVAQAEPDRTAAEKLAADKLAADRAAAAKAAADKKAIADKKAAAAKAAADKKALAEKKAEAEKKAIADKEAAEKKKVERANPQRIWVQVAGGAYEGDLPKAYAAVKAKAPAVFGSRGGWTTPLRATNRVLAGPFKTDAEARAFVNDLKKQGVGAFTFTSDAGQPVKKLGGG